jgi:peptidyl-prolyl cis-trans isomerase D
MLEAIRKAAQGGIGRLVMGVVMLLIIIGFVNWGVGSGGFFDDFAAGKVATVGDQSVSTQEFQNEMQNLLYQYQRRSKVPLTNALARAMGLDRQVLRRLISDAALNQRADSLGLAISDETIALAARSDPNLKDATGQFSRAMFDQALRDSGLTERAFFAQQRKAYLRQQIEFALAEGVDAPKPLVEALAGAEAQTRGIDYFVLPPSAAGEIAAPAPDVLKAYFEDRKSTWRAPEFRAINILLVSPASLSKPAEVSDADARAVYEKEKDTRFASPEKRKLQQVVFPTEAEAEEAEAKIKAGASYDDIAKARGLSPADMDLGEVTKADIFDHAIGDAAFSTPAGALTGVIKGQFGFLIVRVVSVTPGAIKSFPEVADVIKQGIAAERAAGDVQMIHDKIEDARVSGKSLSEAAKAAGLEARAIPAVDARGQDPSGAAVELPEKAELLRAAFASDIGVDDAALNTKDRGFLWFEVTKVDPARDRPFDEVKDLVEKQWREDEIAKALAAKAADLVKQIDAGAAIATVSFAANAEMKSAQDIRRAGGASLPANVVAAVFATPLDKAGSAAVSEGRLVFKVASDVTPPYQPADPAAKTAAERLEGGLRAGLVDQYVSALEKQFGVKIDERALQGAEGG